MKAERHTHMYRNSQAEESSTKSSLKMVRKVKSKVNRGRNTTHLATLIKYISDKLNKYLSRYIVPRRPGRFSVFPCYTKKALAYL